MLFKLLFLSNLFAQQAASPPASPVVNPVIEKEAKEELLQIEKVVSNGLDLKKCFSSVKLRSDLLKCQIKQAKYAQAADIDLAKEQINKIKMLIAPAKGKNNEQEKIRQMFIASQDKRIEDAETLKKCFASAAEFNEVVRCKGVEIRERTKIYQAEFEKQIATLQVQLAKTEAEEKGAATENVKDVKQKK